MFPFSHAFSGFLTALLLYQAGVVELTAPVTIAAVSFSLLPDIDVLWRPELNQHHESVTHTPLLWALVSTAAYIFNPGIGFTVAAASGFHILCDYITGRTSGVPLLYPLSSQQYSLYPTNPETGDFNTLRPEKEKLSKHLSAYLENKTQLMYELAVNVAGFISMIFIIQLL